MDPKILMDTDLKRLHRYPNCAANVAGRGYPCVDCGRAKKFAGPTCPVVADIKAATPSAAA